jgi:uncharacterized protein
MDFTEHWKEFLSGSADLQGGALLSTDGVLITSSAFGRAEKCESSAAGCAALIALAHELSRETGHGECDSVMLTGEQGHVILMPVLDKTVFAVLARRDAKLGLIFLDMGRAIKGPFGPGMATERIFPPRPPKRGSAHAKPEHD